MTQRDRMMLAVVGAVAVLAAVFMLAIKPKREEASQLAAQAQQAQQRRDNALQSLATAKQSRAQYADAQIGIARLGKAVPADDDTAPIVFQLETAARAAGIDFRSLVYSPDGASPTPVSGAGTGAPTGDFTKVPLKLKFEGTYFQLTRFVDFMHSLTHLRNGKYVSVRGRLLSVDAVSLTAAPDGFPHIVASITASAYTAPAPKASTSTATTAGSTTTASGTTTASATTTTTAAGETAR